MEKIILAAAFTGAAHEPCARFRIRQHLGAMGESGVELHDLSSSLGTYPPLNKIMRPAWAIGNILQHIPKVIRSYSYDVSIIQREFLSTIFTLENFTKKPRVLDVDDAIWCHRGGVCATKLARSVDHIICGNQFLANWFGQFNKNITIIPTAVDANYFKPANHNFDSGSQVIGWVGSNSNYRQLYRLEQAFEKILDRHPQAILRVVSNLPPKSNFLSGRRIEYIKWTAQDEVKVLQDITVGIMPLEDSLYTRGKCSFKMLTYMSCAKPVVVSPVGMNRDVLNIKDVGFGPETEDEWVESLDKILSNQVDNVKLGENGREVILSHFHKTIIANDIASVIKSVAK